MEILSQVQQLRQSVPPATPENVEIREKMLSEARRLCLALERPENVTDRICFGLMETVAIRTAVRMGLFDVLNRSPSTTAAEIARECKADPSLTGRILRCLASYGAIEEFGEDSYGPSLVSRTFGQGKSQAALAVCHDLLFPGWIAIPAYLEENKWQTPASGTKTAMAKGWAKPNGATFFEILKEFGPLEQFNKWMSTYNEGHKSWLEVYPALERLGGDVDADPASVMMVDVGGGYGHQASELKRRFPQLPGRYVVQDLAQGLPPPEKRSSEIEYMEHDFNQEQPVKGARLYYLRYINHSWPQSVNIHFCTQIRKAMKKGYSRLIVNEWVVPDVGASRLMTAMDLNMMNTGSGMERTLALHREYLEAAGLKITKVYYPGENISESVIEAEVA